jgi:4-amino-4-deoxy-L-arabinose transferase-like glycosyltransferase
LLLLAAFVSAVYFSRLDALPFRGEETRWARVAWEMRETGDWIVPRQQGQVFADRPPLNSWLMLLVSGLTGSLDRLSVRLPAALATLLTALLLYAYCRQFLTCWGAFTAGLVYSTFPQTLQLGRFAESDAVFTLLVTAALLVWHTGYARDWPRAWTWIAGYALAALSGLAKGPQGPVYFVATVTVFLGLRRDWRCLFSFAHLAGLLAFAAVLGAWQIPFGLAAGSEASAAVWSEEGTLGARLGGIFGRIWWRHLAVYPVEVFGYLLPWSVFLFAVFRPSLWPKGSGVFFHLGG